MRRGKNAEAFLNSDTYRATALEDIMNIIIIGAGGGNSSTYTQEALEGLQGAQVILGAERLLAGIPVKNSDLKLWKAARPSEVCNALVCLKNEKKNARVAI